MEPDSTPTLEILKQMMGIGNGQPSYSSSYDDSILQSYAGLVSQINQHNTYETWTDEQIHEHLMTAGQIIRRCYDESDIPGSMKHNNFSDESYNVEWLLQVVNVPNKMSWPMSVPPLPSRQRTPGIHTLDFGMMANIDMEQKVMTTSFERLRKLDKSTMLFRDEEGTTYKLLMVATKQVFTDRLIPFIYYHNKDGNNNRVHVYVAPKDCAPEINGWQIHIYSTEDSVRTNSTIKRINI